MIRIALMGIIVAMIGFVLGAWKRGGNNTTMIIAIGTFAAAVYVVAIVAPQLITGAP